MSVVKILVILACTIFAGNAAIMNITPMAYICPDGESAYLINATAQTTAQMILVSHNSRNVNYSNNQYCIVQYIAKESVKITVKFSKLDLEISSGCLNDFLCVNSTNYCDIRNINNSTIDYNVPKGKTFTLAFKTNGSTTKTGFQVQVDVNAGNGGNAGGYNDGCFVQATKG